MPSSSTGSGRGIRVSARALGQGLALASAVCLLVPGLRAEPQQPRVGLRLIVVETAAQAADIRERVVTGASFEALASERSIDPTARTGGYMGSLVVGDLRPEFQNALAGVEPGGVSPVFALGGAFALLHRIPAEEERWIEQNRAGLQALQQGRLVEAVTLLKGAVAAAEQLGPMDSRLGESLNALAAIYRLQGDYARAEPLYRSLLPILEARLGPEHLDVATGLNNLAETLRHQGKYAEAEPLYRRSLAILEAVLPADHPNVGQSLNNLAQVLQATEQYAEAELLFRRSLDITERAMGSEHADAATSLNNLAQLLQLRGEYVEAEALMRRGLSILERALGPNHPNVAESLSRLGQLLLAQGDHAGAEPLFQRSLAIRFGGPAGAGSGDLPQLLEKFTAVVRLAYFLDAGFDEVFGEFTEALSGTRVGENLYPAMSSVLVEVARKEEAEAVMLGAREAYPRSWRTRYELAEVYVESSKWQAALEEMLAALERGNNPAPDRRQQSFLHRRVGDIHAELLQFDEAEAAYRTALELDPERLEARLALGDLYLRDNRPEEALAEYAEVAAEDPLNAIAHTGQAEAYLRMRRFAESVAAAEEALRIDPAGGEARYHRARALIQMGQRDEGQSELQEYQRLQASEQAADDGARDVYVLNRDAADRLVAGEEAQAIRMFREGIEAHPDEPAFYFNLAVAQSRMGRHDEAVATLETMLDMGIGDDFLTRRSLAAEYEALGEGAAGERNRVAYLEKIEAELKARAE